MAVVKQRIPLWIATPITVAVATPLATRLGTWGLPVWISFIVWAEYFVLGANMEALKMIGYGFLYGCLMTGFWLASSVALTSAMAFDIAFIITNFIWIGLIVYSFKNPFYDACCVFHWSFTPSRSWNIHSNVRCSILDTNSGILRCVLGMV